MGLSRKSRDKLAAHHKILLNELAQLTVEHPPAQAVAVSTPKAPLKTSGGGLTPGPKKKVGRPKGPSLINTARLLTG